MNFDSPRINVKALARQYDSVGCLLFLLGFGLNFVAKRYLLQTSDAYIRLGEMHGTVSVFFGIVPILFAGLGYYVMPLALGSRMYFPLLDLFGLGLFYLSVVFMLISLFVSDRTVFILAMSLNILFVILCSINFIATIIHLRRKALTWMQMRSVVWALFVTAIILLFNFLLLEFGALRQLADGIFGSYVDPLSSLSINNEPVPDLWKHFFWFLGHPEVYIFLLVTAGAIADGLRSISKRCFAHFR